MQQNNPYATQNRWAEILSQIPPRQVQQQPIRTSPPIENFIHLTRPDQNLPQVDMSRWTPYNNVKITPQGRESINNFVAGVKNLPNSFSNWARNFFGGRSE